MSTRAALAAALDTVADVTGHPTRPASATTGDAWVVRGPAERAAGTAFVETWAVRVLMPQDDVAADAWWSQHWPALFFALEPVMFVDRASPILLDASGGSQLAYEIVGHVEE